MLRIFAKKRSIFILRCNVLNFGVFVSHHIILVSIDDCAFKLMTSSFAYGVNDIATGFVRIGAAGHGNKQMVCLNDLDVMKCDAAVQSYGGNSSELTAVERLSENDVCNVHVVVVLSVSVGSNVDVSNECLTFSVDSVS